MYLYLRFSQYVCYCRPEDFITTEYREGLLDKPNTNTDDEFSTSAPLNHSWIPPGIIVLVMCALWYSKKLQRVRTGRHKKIDS